MLAAFENATLDPVHYQNFLFMTVNVLLQKIGHVYITYLSHGQEEPPRKRIKGVRGPLATMFDMADYTLQEKLFKGRLHYFRDPISGTSEDQVCSMGSSYSIASLVASTLTYDSSAARLT